MELFRSSKAGCPTDVKRHNSPWTRNAFRSSSDSRYRSGGEQGHTDLRCGQETAASSAPSEARGASSPAHYLASPPTIRLAYHGWHPFEHAGAGRGLRTARAQNRSTALFASLKTTALIEASTGRSTGPHRPRAAAHDGRRASAMQRSYQRLTTRVMSHLCLVPVRPWPMKTTPSGRCMPRCACKRRCAAMLIRYGTKGYPPLLMRVGSTPGEVVAALDPQRRLACRLRAGGPFHQPWRRGWNSVSRPASGACDGTSSPHAHGRLLSSSRTSRPGPQSQRGGGAAPASCRSHFRHLQAPPTLACRWPARRKRLNPLWPDFSPDELNWSKLQRSARACQSRARRGQIVGVMGEPGVGGNRACSIGFKTHLPSSGCLVLLTLVGLLHGKASAYLPCWNCSRATSSSSDRLGSAKCYRERCWGWTQCGSPPAPTLFSPASRPAASLRQMDHRFAADGRFETLKKLFTRRAQPFAVVRLSGALH